MLSAAELVQALQRRLRLVAPHLRRPPGQFPPGWQEWLAKMRTRPGTVTGAEAESMVSVLAQRPVPAAAPRSRDLTRWQAFSTLWRQQWTPPAREERPLRAVAGAVSLLWHVLFGALLVWLMYLRYVAVEAPPPEGETVVQVEFIGAGTPDEVGGGANAQQADPPDTAGAPAVALSPVPPSDPRSTVADQPPSPPLPAEDVPVDTAAAEPPSSIEQPLAISEPVPDRTSDFVLPPPVPRVQAPALATPELQPSPSSMEVQVVEIPQPRPAPEPEPEPAQRPSLPTVRVTTTAIDQPVLDRPAPDIAVREIPAPMAEPTQPAPSVAIPSPPIAMPALQPATSAISPITVPSPRPSAPVQVPASGAPPGQAATAEKSPPTADSGRPSVAPPGAGPAKTAAAGSWPTPRKADDWGDSTRDVPGGQRGSDGLYNSDGSVRLADSPGSAAPGNPPGTVTDEITDLDRAGTWLKRPPIGYEPTALDKYWRPSETLLAEWVRKSIKTVRIPIPGTSKHIVCETVLLALGGSCGISDPNLNEQPPSARPPPDIPFKPELQEDNGSIRPPVG